MQFCYKINIYVLLLTLSLKRCIMFIVICECAGIGRQARLRGVCRKTYGFKSHYSHQQGVYAGSYTVLACSLSLYLLVWTDGWAGLRRTTGTRVYVNSVSRVRIPLCPPELKSLYFEENTEIQAFLLPTKNSFKWKFAVPCAQKTGVMHTKCTRTAPDERQYNDN